MHLVLNPSPQERDELKLAREKLEQERQQFEEEGKRVQQVFNDGEQVQSLTVGLRIRQMTPWR